MPDPTPAANTDAMLDGESPPGMPRWLKVSGIVVLVLILVFLGVHLAGGGVGPSEHLRSLGGH